MPYRGVSFVHQPPPGEFCVQMEEDAAKDLRDVLHQAKDSDEVELNKNLKRILVFLDNELPFEFDGFTGGEESQ